MNGKFYKLWPEEAPGHNFLLSNSYNALVKIGLTAQLNEFGKLRQPCLVRGKNFNYLYIFSQLKADKLDINEVLQALYQGEDWWIKNWLLLFQHLELARFAYFDMDWSNIGLVKNNQQMHLVFYDIDSTVDVTKNWQQIWTGNATFHTLFSRLRQEYKETTLQFFNIASLTELYIATILAYIVQNPLILELNKYGAGSYYISGHACIPSGMPVDSRNKQIIEKFLIYMLNECKDVFEHKKHPKDSLKNIAEYTIQVIKEPVALLKDPQIPQMNPGDGKNLSIFKLLRNLWP